MGCAAISYELLKLSGRYRDSIPTRILITPGLAFQRLTTREPDDDMIEVAIKAVEEVNRLSNEPLFPQSTASLEKSFKDLQKDLVLVQPLTQLCRRGFLYYQYS